MRKWMICCTKEEFNKNASIFRILANPIRLEILNHLRVRDHTVEELIRLIGVRKANISQHLSTLRYLGLVEARRNGQNISYCLTKPRIVEVCRILREVSEEVETI